MFNKPWFSRKQLNIIILVTTLAIALLSMTGPKKLPTAQLEPLNGTQMVYMTEKGSSQYLRLSFLLPPGQHASEFAPQLLFRVLQEQLQQQVSLLPLRARLQHDRIQVDLITSEPPSQQAVTELLEALAQTGSDPLWLHTAQELQARRYLAQQSNPSPLNQLSPLIGLNQRSQENAVYLWQDFHRQVINRHNLHLSYLGPDIKPWRELLAQGLQLLPTAPHKQQSADQWPQPQRLNRAPQGYQTLMLRQTDGKADREFALQLLSIQLINRLLPAETLHDWVTAGNHGYWLLASQSTEANTLLLQLQSAIGEFSDRQFQDLQQQTLDQLQQIPENPEALLNQLESINLYQLPLDRLPKLAAQLEAVSLQQAQQQALQFIDVKDFYWISSVEAH